jgi:hypothetical protein
MNYEGAPDGYAATGADATEIEAWDALGHVARLMMHDLKPMHPMEKTEYAEALHTLQNALLARPAYRTYLAASGLNPYGWWPADE